MRIEDIDKNLLVVNDIAEPDILWLDIRNAPLTVCGVHYDEERGCYVRMPQDLAGQVSEGVETLNLHTAGGRVRFRTNSVFIGIHAVMDNAPLMPHMTLAGQSGFDLYRKLDGAEREVYYRTFMPRMGMTNGYSAPVATDGAMADYTINFPLYDGVKELYIALKKDAALEAASPYRNTPPVVYYGSSVTQGGCASRPGNSYQAILSRYLNMDYLNLGYSGSARGEMLMAEYIAGLTMSAFVYDYDNNAPSAEHLQETHLPFYRIVRKAHPEIPIIMISAQNIRTYPEKFEERREILRKSYGTALAEGDKNVYFIDGEELFAGADWDSCTVDGSHPNDMGFHRMAMRILEMFKKIPGIDCGSTKKWIDKI